MFYCRSLSFLIYTLNRASVPATRKKYVGLVEAVQEKGGEVLVFSSMHESGQRKIFHSRTVETRVDHSVEFVELNQLTGIAAILTFPLDVEVVETEEREAEEERQRQALEGRDAS